jgi:hypothetical protein
MVDTQDIRTTWDTLTPSVNVEDTVSSQWTPTCKVRLTNRILTTEKETRTSQTAAATLATINTSKVETNSVAFREAVERPIVQTKRFKDGAAVASRLHLCSLQQCIAFLDCNMKPFFEISVP